MIQKIQPFPNQYKTYGNFRQILDKSSYFEPGYGSIDLELGIIQEPDIYRFQCKFGVSWQKQFDFGEFKKKGDFKFLTKMGRLTRNLDSMFSIVFKNSSSGIFDILIFGQNMSKIRPTMVKNYFYQLSRHFDHFCRTSFCFCASIVPYILYIQVYIFGHNF